MSLKLPFADPADKKDPFMPTMPRLFAAICLAALAFVLSEQVKIHFDEDKNFGLFNLINVGLGFVIGWQVIGSRVGRGMSAAAGNGVTAGLVLLFWALFAHSAVRMVELAMRKKYDNILEASAAVFQLMWDNLLLISTPMFFVIFLAGALISGLVAELTSKVAS